MEIVFLGTGSPRELDRANAAVAVRLGSGGAGEAGEVVLFDTAGGNEILRQLRAAGISPTAIHHVVVSHQHFDHAAGLGILLLQMSRLGGAPIWVYVPSAGAQAIQSVVEVQCPRVIGGRLKDRLRLVPLQAGDAVDLALPGAAPALGRLVATPAVHPVPGMGCILEWNGRRVGYSGDTAPFDGAGEAYAGVDVLIHEASGLEGTEADLHAIGHSTASDAARVAAEARAGRLALTHYPPRTPDELRAMQSAASGQYGGPVTVAQDFDTLTLP